MGYIERYIEPIVGVKNVLPNYSFETGDLTNWEWIGGGSVTIESTGAYHGTYVAVVSPSPSYSIYLLNTRRIPVAPGIIMRLQGWLKADENIESSGLIFIYYDVDDNVVAEDMMDPVSGPYDYYNFSHVSVAPKGAVYVKAGVKATSSGSASGNLWVDMMEVPMLKSSRDLLLEAAKRLKYTNKVEGTVGDTWDILLDWPCVDYDLKTLIIKNTSTDEQLDIDVRTTAYWGGIEYPDFSTVLDPGQSVKIPMVREVWSIKVYGKAHTSGGTASYRIDWIGLG